MSYILDALKRAEAQRQQAAPPGLHLLQEPVPLGKLPSEPLQSRKAWRFVLGLAVLSAGAAVGYWQSAGQQPQPAPIPAVQVAAAVAVPLPAASQPVLTPHTVRPVAPPPDAPATPKPVPKPAFKADEKAEAKAQVKTEAKVESKVADVPAMSASAKVASQLLPTMPTRDKPTSLSAQAKASEPKVLTEAAAPVATPEIPKLSELPEATRRQLPVLSVTGSVYSDNPTQRLLVVNGQVLTQGSQMGPELRLEDIGVKSSVFNFAGTRFKVPH